LTGIVESRRLLNVCRFVLSPTAAAAAAAAAANLLITFAHTLIATFLSLVVWIADVAKTCDGDGDGSRKAQVILILHGDD
jgi:hypothetical protein